MKMRKIQLAVAAVILALFGMRLGTAQDQNTSMSFFVTSEGPGNGANLGGLDGADRYCQKLAAAAGAGSRTWRAYLSASATGGKPAVNARDRIGKGPWYNAKGVKIADNVADLHSDNNNLKKETALDEKGNPVNARGDKPNKHDILTGSQPDGTAYPADTNMTCQNWTIGNSGNLPGRPRSATMTARDSRPGYPRGTRRTPRAAAARKT
jgi:hypothetical protein